MSFRQIVVKNANQIKVELNNIILSGFDNHNIVKINIEEVAIIVIENNRANVSINFLNECSSHNIIILLCDEKYLPKSLIMPLNRHYQQLKNFYLQLELKTVSKQNLWREIIKNKINNQIQVMKLNACDEQSIEMMNEYLVGVVRNDETNREGISARVFFNGIYGDEFIRFVSDEINPVLNYGYSMLAASIIRQLCSYGIDCKIGIWHQSKSNSFNLAYDLIEPFRPLIDYYISQNREFTKLGLNVKVRRDILAVLNYQVEVEGIKYRVQNAIELYVKSYLSFLNNEVNRLVKINIIRVRFHEFERV